MVALNDEQLKRAGNVPKKLAEQYAVARGNVARAEYLHELDTESQKLIDEVHAQYPAFLAIYDEVVQQVALGREIFKAGQAKD